MSFCGVDITAGNNTKLDNINVYSNLDEIPNPIDVVIDFTNSEGAETTIQKSKNHGFNIVIGSTGIPEKVITDASNIAKEKKLIQQVGFSSHGSQSLIKEAIESRYFQFCSLHVHLLDQGNLPLANTWPIFTIKIN